jgi:hypothetical protein
MPFKRMTLTDLTVEIPRLASKKVLTAAFNSAGATQVTAYSLCFFVAYGTHVAPGILCRCMLHAFFLRACSCTVRGIKGGGKA